MPLAAHHHQQQQHQHHHQQQQHQHHPPPPSQQQQQHIDQRGVTITTLPSATTVAQHQQQHQHIQDGSPHHHFNVAALGDLSSAMQLGAVTADGSFVTMGGVVVGRIQHTREELQQLGVIKVESPSNGGTATTSATAETQREG